MNKSIARRPALVSLLSVLALSLSGCASLDNPVTVGSLLKSQPELSTLAGLVQQAGLNDVVEGTPAVTLFAPNNDAFKAVPAAALDKLAKDPVALKAVLMHHAVAGTQSSTALPAGTTVLTSLGGGKLSVAKAGDFVTLDEAMVVRANLTAVNGVVHVIDRVVMPPKK